MSITLNGTRSQTDASAVSGTNTIAYTIGAGTSRKAIIMEAGEAIIAVNSVTFNAASATARKQSTFVAGDNCQAQMWTYDIPDALADGSYDVVVTYAAAAATHSIAITCINGAATGAQEDDASGTSAADASSAISLTVTSTDGAWIFSIGDGNSGSQTWSVTAGTLTERFETTPASQNHVYSGDGEQSGAGDKTITWTQTSASSDKLAIACSFAVASAGGAPVGKLVGGKLLNGGILIGGRLVA